MYAKWTKTYWAAFSLCAPGWVLKNKYEYPIFDNINIMLSIQNYHRVSCSSDSNRQYRHLVTVKYFYHWKNPDIQECPDLSILSKTLYCMHSNSSLMCSIILYKYRTIFRMSTPHASFDNVWCRKEYTPCWDQPTRPHTYSAQHRVLYRIKGFNQKKYIFIHDINT